MASNQASKSEPFLFAGQPLVNDTENAAFNDLPAWTILVVDDEPEVHKVTQIALESTVISGRRLQFVNAYSAHEAKEVLIKRDDIAVAILDVVMESDDAGLKLVETIREDMQRHDMRIILRTGQPGYAPEEQVVVDYDINDYVTKTELTRNRLLTTLCTAIRSYEQIKHINESKEFLHKLTLMNSALIQQKAL